MKKKIKISVFLLCMFFSSKGQFLYPIDSVKWHTYLDAAIQGSRDISVNRNKKVCSPNGACKINFMNIQHRMHNERININDTATQRIALDMSMMQNAFHKNTHHSKEQYINPTISNKTLTLKEYLLLDDKSNIDIGIVNFITKKMVADTIQNGYFAFAFGVTACYHLFHLFIEIDEGKIQWYLFDNFGLNGSFVNELNPNHQTLAMTQEEVSSYLLKYFYRATRAYKNSPTLKNAVTINNVHWEADDRPLWTKFYSIEK